jgi:hypothetical protein
MNADAQLFDALITGNARKVMDELFPRSPQQPMPGNPALVEGTSPCADLGTAEVSDSSERAMAERHLGVAIVTNHVFPPIPCRRHDWCAYPDGEEENGNYGWGPTEAAAIADLIEILRDDERLPIREA